MAQSVLTQSLQRRLQQDCKQGSLIMGVLNVTPDSFSDGGKFVGADSALEHAHTLIEQGADIIDVGGESTRPGAEAVSVQQELDRVLPIVELIQANHSSIPISVDTSKPEVMQAAIDLGVAMINDVTALKGQGAKKIVADSRLPVCIMHMQGQPRTMQAEPQYVDVVREVVGYLSNVADECIATGIQREHIIVDPGIGFGKTLEHNLRLLGAIPAMKALGLPVLIGVSRKSMIDHLLKRPVEQRLPASLALAAQAVINGADIVRVHDVQATFDAIRSVEAVMQFNVSDS